MSHLMLFHLSKSNIIIIYYLDTSCKEKKAAYAKTASDIGDFKINLTDFQKKIKKGKRDF